MQCERLISMIKSWYIHVREETMAPARMVSFMEQHVATCNVCQQDPEVNEEIAKITELVLPESKIPKAVRQQNSKYDDDETDDSDDYEDTNDDSEDDDLDDDGDDEDDELEEDDLDLDDIDDDDGP